MRAAPLLVFVIVLAGCSKGQESADAAMESAKAAMPGEQFSAGAVAAAPPAGGLSARSFRPVDKMSDFRSGKAEAKAAAFAPVEVQRMIVRNGELSLRVKDVRIAEAQVWQVARAARGALEASEGTGLEGTAPSLSITLRVPEPLFDATMTNLENLGTRLGKTITSEDVTAQAVDLEARIKSLRVQEDAYRAILSAARKISDVLEVQERLTGVRTEIEQLVAQRRGLGDQAARSKIVLTLSQNQMIAAPPAPPVEPNWMAQTWREATGALSSVAKGLASLALWLLVMSPVWLPVGLVGMLFYRRTRVAV